MTTNPVTKLSESLARWPQDDLTIFFLACCNRYKPFWGHLDPPELFELYESTIRILVQYIQMTDRSMLEELYAKIKSSDHINNPYADTFFETTSVTAMSAVGYSVRAILSDGDASSIAFSCSKYLDLAAIFDQLSENAQTEKATKKIAARHSPLTIESFELMRQIELSSCSRRSSEFRGAGETETPHPLLDHLISRTTELGW